MGKWGKILGVVAMVIASAAIAAELKDELYPSGSVHYKMTVEVDTPEGVKSGYAVREVYLYTEPPAPGYGGGGHAGIKGEAVVIDLGKRGKLFALLRNSAGPDYAYRVLFRALPWPGGPGGSLTPDGIRYYRSLKEGKAVLPPELYPDMVTFKDLNDPKSVEPVWIGRVHLEQIGNRNKDIFRVDEDNFERLFGESVKLKSVTIEVAQRPITTGIGKFLSWLPNYYDQMLDGLRYNTAESKNPLANSLSAGAFSTELSQHGQ